MAPASVYCVSERVELVAFYESGVSIFELSRRFDARRHPVARHLRRAGVQVVHRIRYVLKSSPLPADNP